MKQTVEINGVKFEIDMSTAKRIDTFRVGDNVKILKHKRDILDGVIVGFYNFKEMPTVQVAVFEESYYDTGIKFYNINSETEDLDILPSTVHDLKMVKNKVVEKMQNKIGKLQDEIDDLQNKLKWFNEYYNKYFSEVE